MTKKPLTSHLLVRVLLDILLGVACGLSLPERVARVFLTFNGLFGAFLGFTIPLLIVGLVPRPSVTSAEVPASGWA